MNSAKALNSIRFSKLPARMLLLLAWAIPFQLFAQAPSVSTGGSSSYGGDVELSGTATYNGPGPVDLYTWFEWGTSTSYGNASPQVVNPQYGYMNYMITDPLQPNTVYHYRAVAQNAYGTSYGGDATFTSSGPPTINNQPHNQTVAVGATATFTVDASSSDGVLFYQWEKDGVDIPSATSSSLTITNAQYSDAGTYMVYVASDWGGEYPVYSSPASLIVGSGPTTITLLPPNQTVAPGTTATFTAVVGGAAPFAYQWFFNGTNLAGATANVLTLPNVQLSNAGTYSLAVTNAYGSATNANAILTVSLPLLKASLTNGNLVLSWPAFQPAYNLKSSTNPHSTNWTSVAGTPVTNGNTAKITVPVSGGGHFFRLQFP